MTLLIFIDYSPAGPYSLYSSRPEEVRRVLSDEERLRKAKELASPLRRRYGMILAALLPAGIVLILTPLPAPVVALAGGAVLLAIMFVGLRWHIKLQRALNSLGPPDS